MKISSLFFTAGLAGCWSGTVIAQTTTALNAEATKMNTLASSQGDSNVVDKISADFSSFLGADSKAVVTGLRNGTPITLTTTAPSSTTGAAITETTIINPPTGKMGHGNVFISLALAKQQLGDMGITQPSGNGSGSGIVSALGKVGATSYGNAHGKSGIVTGSGHGHSSGGVVSAGGNGSGHGKGRSN